MSSATCPYVMRIRGACGGASPSTASHGLDGERVVGAKLGRASVSPWRGGRILERARVRVPGAPHNALPAPRSHTRCSPYAYRHRPTTASRPARAAPATRLPRRGAAHPHRLTHPPTHRRPRKTFAFLTLISAS